MAKAKKESSSRKVRPAINPEARENQMISLAVDCAEKQMLDGTASSQIITHYLKLATVKEQLAVEKLKAENELLKAKTEAIQSQKVSEELYAKAIGAILNYQGRGDEDYD